MAALSAECAESVEIESYMFYETFLDIIMHFQSKQNFRGVLCSNSPHRAAARQRRILETAGALA